MSPRHCMTDHAPGRNGSAVRIRNGAVDDVRRFCAGAVFVVAFVIVEAIQL